MEIRKTERKDLVAIVGLMKNFAEYEKLSGYFDATPEKLSSVMFDDDAFVDGLIAEDDGKLIGYALFYPHFATFRGQRGFYLEDIYIAPDYQGRGIGEAMLREIAKIGRERGCERIDFQVLEWNTSAIGFYERLGAVRNDDERHFKFSDDAFARLSG